MRNSAVVTLVWVSRRHPLQTRRSLRGGYRIGRGITRSLAVTLGEQPGTYCGKCSADATY